MSLNIVLSFVHQDFAKTHAYTSLLSCPSTLPRSTIVIRFYLPIMSPPTPKTSWLFFAIASGCCAALNGVFAKLTTTQLTTTWATALSHFIGLKDESKIFEFLVRGFFFLMNLAFNAVMWGLFTRALTLASSTVRVSVINTSANFVITALLGALIFREGLPGKSQ